MENSSKAFLKSVKDADLNSIFRFFGQYPLKSDPWQRLTPPLYNFVADTIERGANAAGMSIPHPATTKEPYKALFFLFRRGGGV